MEFPKSFDNRYNGSPQGGQPRNNNRRNHNGNQPGDNQNRQHGATSYNRSSQPNSNWNRGGSNSNRNDGQRQFRPNLGGDNKRNDYGQRSQGQSNSNYSNQRIARPNAGGEFPEGSKFEIEANYLDLILNSKIKCAYHYDVKIDAIVSGNSDRPKTKADKPKECPKKFMRPAFEKYCSEVFPNILIAYDGKASCYSIEKLDSSLLRSRIVTVHPEAGKPFEIPVTMTETKDSFIDLTALESYQKDCISDKPMRALQCLDVALAQPCHTLGVRSGRSFYYKPKEQKDLTAGYELWYGLFQSVVLGQRLLFNIDVSHKAFVKSISVIDFLHNSNPRDRNPNEYSLLDILKNKEIIYTPPKEFNAKATSFRLHALGNSADKEFFNHNNENTSVQEYYKSKGYELQYPFYKLLKNQKGSCFPMELCSVAFGQSDPSSSNKNVSQIIRYATTTTQERKAKIMELFKHFHGSKSPIIEKFGVTFGQSFIKLEASRLFAPKLSYNESSVKPSNGKWSIRDNMQFLEPAVSVQSNIKWAIVNLDQYMKRLTLDNCKTKLVSIAENTGISLDSKPMYYDLGRASMEKIFHEIKSSECQFALIVLPERGRYSYANVKQTAELQCGIITQCIKSNTISRRWDNSTVSNILLKLNSKLNGVNHKVDPQSNPPLVSNNYVMFVGADVTHPSPQQSKIPSVVGVVSSTDSTGSTYNMQHFYQEPKKEIIVDFCYIMVDHLRLYAKKNQGNLPTHIFYYRDGVADCQFEQVTKCELDQGMKSAFAEISKRSGKKYEPKLTCIIVQKRNHTRFFPLENGPSFGRMMNVFPGTVVDKVICHPKMKEFFLVSHESGLGTAKPAKYIVIRDDSNIKLEDIQKLTFNLCHLFPRCNKAVSYPTPAYLAHLAAARGKVYIEGNPINMGRLAEVQKRNTIIKEIKENNPMFFV